MLEPIPHWLTGTDRGVSEAISLGILVVVVVTLALAVALFVFAGT